MVGKPRLQEIQGRTRPEAVLPVGGHVRPGQLAQPYEDAGQRAGGNGAHNHRQITEPDGQRGGQEEELDEGLREAPDQRTVGPFLGYAHVVELVGAGGE